MPTSLETGELGKAKRTNSTVSNPLLLTLPPGRSNSNSTVSRKTQQNSSRVRATNLVVVKLVRAERGAKKEQE